MQPSAADQGRTKRLWVTRAEPGAAATADRLHALGLEALVFPLLAVERIDVVPDLDGVGGLVFTSANAVRAFANLSPRRAFAVFAVGEATATAARAAGFIETTVGASDGAALTELITTKWRATSGILAVITPEAPAFDVAKALSAAGLSVRRLVLYRTVSVTVPPPGLLDAVAAGVDGVLIHSPRAAEALAALPLPAAVFADVTLYALSEACAQPLRALPWREIRVADHPREDALLQLIS
jgi:uroporphyrinogen-III synthase